MLRKFIALSIVCFTVLYATAQNGKIRKTSFLLGPQASVAVGKDLATMHSVGIGVNAQVVHNLNEKNSVTGRVGYTYLLGKKYHYVLSPGDGGGEPITEHGKHKGMSDVNIMAGLRHNLPNNWFAGFDLGLCMDFGGGRSETSGAGTIEIGYVFGESADPFLQMLALFFGICGDPKMQIGVRYYIRL